MEGMVKIKVLADWVGVESCKYQVPEFGWNDLELYEIASDID
jgi:hypothetical protein